MGAGYYYLTAAIVLLGAILGATFLTPPPGRDPLISGLTSRNGHWYKQIASEGYEYVAGRRCNAAFFPAYPLLARFVARISGVRVEMALLVVTQACLIGALALTGAYVRARFPHESSEFAEYVVLAMALFPTTFYLRMAYAESMFLFLAITAFYGMVRKWPLAVLSAVIGLATATRPVGVALVVPFVMHVWGEATSWRKFLGRAVWLLPLACWGLVAFMVYQASAFGDPLAFAKAQEQWSEGTPPSTLAERVTRVVTFAPVRAVYDRESPCYWGLKPPRDSLVFNLAFANPLYLALTAIAVALGAKRRWLDSRELVLAVLLILIPYAFQADRFCMMSHARFASVVFPAYIVWGRVLAALSPPLSGAVMGLCGFMLGAYSAMFVSWDAFY